MQYGELVSEMVYCVSYTWWVFTVVCDDGGEVLGGLIYVGENFPF